MEYLLRIIFNYVPRVVNNDCANIKTILIILDDTDNEIYALEFVRNLVFKYVDAQISFVSKKFHRGELFYFLNDFDLVSYFCDWNDIVFEGEYIFDLIVLIGGGVNFCGLENIFKHLREDGYIIPFFPINSANSQFDRSSFLQFFNEYFLQFDVVSNSRGLDAKIRDSGYTGVISIVELIDRKCDNKIVILLDCEFVCDDEACIDFTLNGLIYNTDYIKCPQHSFVRNKLLGLKERFSLDIVNGCEIYFVNKYPVNIYFRSDDRVKYVTTIIGDINGEMYPKMVSGSYKNREKIEGYFQEITDLGVENENISEYNFFNYYMCRVLLDKIRDNLSKNKSDNLSFFVNDVVTLSCQFSGRIYEKGKLIVSALYIVSDEAILSFKGFSNIRSFNFKTIVFSSDNAKCHKHSNLKFF